MGRMKHACGRPDFDYLAEIHDRDPIRQIAYDPKIVGDEKIGHVLARLQVCQKVQDGGLDRDVERGGRLVAEDQRRRSGKGAGYGDALLEPAGKRDGAKVEMLWPQADGRCERGNSSPRSVLRSAPWRAA